MNVLVHIPARGGSKGIPRKNLRTVLGVSLVGWAVLVGRRIRALLGPRATVRILVDTDDEDIAAEGVTWGAEVPFRRPPELARDETPTARCVVHAVGRLREAGWSADAIVLLQPTSPLRIAEDAMACLAPFLAGGSESVVSVVPLDHPLELAYTLDGMGTLTAARPLPGGAIRRQDGTRAWFPSGAVYVISSALLSATDRFLHDGSTLGIDLPRNRSIDIDAEPDLTLAESVARGEALARGFIEPDHGLTDPTAEWRAVELGALPAGLASFESAVGTDGAALLIRAPGTSSAGEVFDGVAACRRATGLPVAWMFDPQQPDLVTPALSAGAVALLVRGARREDREAAERLIHPWHARLIVTP